MQVKVSAGLQYKWTVWGLQILSLCRNINSFLPKLVSMRLTVNPKIISTAFAHINLRQVVAVGQRLLINCYLKMGCLQTSFFRHVQHI